MGGRPPDSEPEAGGAAAPGIPDVVGSGTAGGAEGSGGGGAPSVAASAAGRSGGGIDILDGNRELPARAAVPESVPCGIPPPAWGKLLGGGGGKFMLPRPGIPPSDREAPGRSPLAPAPGAQWLCVPTDPLGPKVVALAGTTPAPPGRPPPGPSNPPPPEPAGGNPELLIPMAVGPWLGPRGFEGGSEFVSAAPAPLIPPAGVLLAVVPGPGVGLIPAVLVAFFGVCCQAPAVGVDPAGRL